MSLGEKPATAQDEAMKIGELAKAAHTQVETIRYYEREGLLRNVARASSGHRRYDQNDVLWVQVLRCLRATGMTIQDLRHYCDLGEQGTSSEPERYALLVAHRETVRRQLTELEESLELIEHKMSHYPQHQPSVDGGSER